MLKYKIPQIVTLTHKIPQIVTLTPPFSTSTIEDVSS